MPVKVAPNMGKYLGAFLVYALLEMFAYKVVGFGLRATSGNPFDYQDWVYLFYFPEKKIKFIYYLVFMVSTWAYFLALSFHFNRMERNNASAE